MTDIAERRVDWYPPGPIAKAFALSDAFVCGILGPIGSAKSTTAVMKLIRNVQKQQRLKDGWIRRRTVIIRNTYSELRTTTIKTWHQWVPPSVGNYRDTSPPTHTIEETATKIHWEVIFIALDRPEDVRKLLSMEVSDAWINEAREVPKAILDGLTGRVGRFPRREEGGCTDPQILMDTNPPDSDHWWYRLAEDPTPEDAELNAELQAKLRELGALREDQPLYEWFRQPGGEDPAAENLQNLPPGYYLKAKANKSPEWIKVYIDANYGFVLDGRPVYPEYRDGVHCREFAFNPRLGLHIGVDFGLTPAAVFGQRMPNGQWRKHSEVVTENMGILRFGDLVVSHIAKLYPGVHIESFTGDPAGIARGGDERTSFDLLETKQLFARPAVTNDPTLRIEAVRTPMNRMIDGEPGMLIHPQCRVLRKGYAGGYNYRRVQVSGDERFRDEPDKNLYSHVCFVAGTLIDTPRGAVPIEKLRIGDTVSTPFGPRPIRFAFTRTAEVQDFGTVTCTPDHPFFTLRGFIRADAVQSTDIVARRGKTWAILFRLLHFAVGRSGLYTHSSACVTTGAPMATGSLITRAATAICIAMCGRLRTALSRLGTWFTIATATRPTPAFPTWNACLIQDTPSFTWPTKGARNQAAAPSLEQSPVPPSGARTTRSAPPPLPALLVMPPMWREKSEERMPWFARTVAPHTWGIQTFESADSAGLPAKPLRAAPRALTMLIVCALSAVARFARTSTPRSRLAQMSVKGHLFPKLVYNLDIADAHCYYANGFLVSNCDADQYMAIGGGEGKVITRQEPRKDRPAFAISDYHVGG